MKSDSIVKLVTLVRELSTARSLEEVMKIVRVRTREVIGSDGVTFVLRDGDKCFYADEDAIQPLWKGSRFPLETCISGWAMLNRKAAVIEDIYSDSRIPADAYRPTFVKSLVMVPIRKKEPLGAIGNYWATPHLATPEEVDLIQSIADFASITLENINLYSNLNKKVKELESVNQTKDEFLMNLSHELRTPLCSILGWSELLLKDRQANPEEAKLGLKAIEGNSQNLLKMIDDLLDMSKMVIGRFDFEKKPLDPSELVMETVDSLRTLATKKNIQLSVDVKEFSKIVMGDAPRIRQAVKNILSNAIQFTPKGGKISVVLDRDQGFFRMTFTDTGIGMDPETIPLIFERFRQKDGSTTRKQGGLGLGLSIARFLIEEHGGHILASSPGKDQGSVFSIYLPILPVQVERTPQESPESFGFSAQQLSVLVVDDSEDTLQILKALLDRLGFHVQLASGASEALSLLDQRVPSILLSDLSMPDIDGYELIRKVRASGVKVPAIALTAFTDKGRKEEALSSGFDAVLSKPVSADVLLGALQKYLLGLQAAEA